MKPVLFLAAAALANCSVPAQTLDDPVLQDLSFVVSPVTDSPKGQTNAIRIMSCALTSARKDWPEPAFAAFSKDLSHHASGVKADTAKLAQLTPAQFEAALVNGSLTPTRPTPALEHHLNRLAPLLIACEDRIGGPGVEF